MIGYAIRGTVLRDSLPELAVLTADDRIRRNSAPLGFDVLPSVRAGRPGRKENGR